MGWTGKSSHVQLEQIRHFPFSKNKSQSAGGIESTVTFLLSLALLSAAALLLFFGGKMAIAISDYASNSLACPSGAVSYCRYPSVGRVMGHVHLAAHIPELCAPSVQGQSSGHVEPGSPPSWNGFGAACSVFVLCVLSMASPLHPRCPLPLTSSNPQRELWLLLLCVAVAPSPQAAMICFLLLLFIYLFLYLFISSIP